MRGGHLPNRGRGRTKTETKNKKVGICKSGHLQVLEYLT